MVTVGNVNKQRMLMLQGKCTENCLLPSFDVASFLLLFHWYKISLLSLESIPVYRNAVDLGQLHKTIDALETAR